MIKTPPNTPTTIPKIALPLSRGTEDCSTGEVLLLLVLLGVDKYTDEVDDDDEAVDDVDTVFGIVVVDDVDAISDEESDVNEEEEGHDDDDD